MKLEKKKAFAAKTFDVGKDRVIFNNSRLSDIKEAITRQDIRDLVNQKAIVISETHGRRAVLRKTSRRRFGSVRKRVKDKKRRYIIITRKLRSYLAHLRRQGKLPEEKYQRLRKDIRARAFHSLAHMKEMGGLK